jgi:tRNA A-37 threonylcarbamoyl transferase component Bud32
MSIRPETAQTLRLAGRTPPAAFHIQLDDGRLLSLQRVLRVLPGKRLTGIGEIEGRPVLAKFFIAERGAERHWERERRGISALLNHQIQTPQLIAVGSLKDGGHYLLTEFIDGTQSLAQFEDMRVLPVFRMLGLMHAHSLVQEDAHLGNFLLKGDTLYVIDGDSIRTKSSPLDALRNLALLLAQLPPAQEASARKDLLAAYGAGNPVSVLDFSLLEREIVQARAHRLADYLDKCLRDCSLFKVNKRHDRFVAVERDESDFLAPIMADPDRWLDGGISLKRGRTATLAMIDVGGRKLVIKRYNIKSPWHALSRCWRPSRAWHSWVEGQRLKFLGIPTPRPLAMIEQRLGPLRGRAWLIVEYCAGENLAERMKPYINAGPPALELQAVRELFGSLAAARISHGDLKATNLLWNDDRLCLIDLDAMHQHEKTASYAKAWRKDRARFLQNWPEGSALRQAIETVLPDV